MLKRVVEGDAAAKAQRMSRLETHDISERPTTPRMMGDDLRGQWPRSLIAELAFAGGELLRQWPDLQSAAPVSVLGMMDRTQVDVACHCRLDAPPRAA